MTKTVLNVVAFTNSIDQTIEPGDPVVIVTSGYNHRVNTKKGTYLGRKGMHNGVHCRVVENYVHYRHKETGREVPSWYQDARIVYPSMDRSLKYGTPQYEEARLKYLEEYNACTAVVNAIRDEYEPFNVPYYRHTTLHLNRIFKIDTLLAESAKL